MNVFHLLKNPIIKTIGISTILYFTLFSNKSPNSLRSRLSSQNIRQDLGEVAEKSKFIISNLQAATTLAEGKMAEKKINAPISDYITVKDHQIGKGAEAVSCGDEVEISYEIYTENNKQLDLIKSEKLIIGSKKNPLIEQSIIGMKLSGSRYINIPRNFKTTDTKLEQTLKLVNENLEYQVNLISLKQNPGNKNTICNF